jgi:hypothetical protein
MTAGVLFCASHHVDNRVDVVGWALFHHGARRCNIALALLDGSLQLHDFSAQLGRIHLHNHIHGLVIEARLVQRL